MQMLSNSIQRYEFPAKNLRVSPNIRTFAAAFDDVPHK